MLGLELSVDTACWRKAHARELIETEIVPPPSTVYGSLLSLVGETDRSRHRGCRVTAGLLNSPAISTVLCTRWQIKDRKTPQGNGKNTGPDFQQLVVDAQLMVWCDSSGEPDPTTGLENRVIRALQHPEEITRFGAWSLGESTHLINDAWLRSDAQPPASCRAFLLGARGNLTLPVSVDHVGSARTRYVTGRLTAITTVPDVARIPQIPLS
jgi:CRISPR-associated protein Cas5t